MQRQLSLGRKHGQNGGSQLWTYMFFMLLRKNIRFTLSSQLVKPLLAPVAQEWMHINNLHM
jgi:hypothetical protein